MTSAVSFVTPGHLDLEAIRTFGINAKPKTDNPIGFFGTGLKNAIAVLSRMEIPISVFIGEYEHVFYKSNREFRGKEFDFVRMKRRGIRGMWSYDKLPFTTELARHWDLWMAYRELGSNTIDEGGVICPYEAPPKNDSTVIVVRDEDFADFCCNDGRVFIKKELPLLHESDTVKIYDAPANYVYYRGMRVMDLDKPSMFTYDFGGRWLTLTEDRTLRQQYTVPYFIVSEIKSSEKSELMQRAIKAQEGSYEYHLPWDNESVSGRTVKFNTLLLGMSSIGNPRLRTYADKIRTKPAPSLAERLRHWIADGTLSEARIALLEEVIEKLENPY